MILVSVIMPVHDGGHWLRPAVDSILGQRSVELELILVDDHSSDGAIAELDRSDSRLKILESPGQGVSAAFNHGLERSKGDFVARMDADDIALPERLATQLDYLQAEPGVGICGACVELFSEDEIADGNKRYQVLLNSCRTPGQIRRQMYIESLVPNPTAVFRREVIMQLQGYADPPWPEDYDLYLRAHELGIAMGKPKPVLLRWREHDRRLTHRDNRYQWPRFQQAKAFYLSREFARRSIESVVIWGAGPSGARFHDLLLERGIECAGFLEVHPRRIGQRKRGKPVWAIDHLAALNSEFIVAAVGAAGAREEIREFMNSHGRKEGSDWLFVA